MHCPTTLHQRDYFSYYINKYKLIKLHATTRGPSYKRTLWIEMKNDGRNKSCPACISLSLCPFYHFCGHLMMCWKEINNVGGISILFNLLRKISIRFSYIIIQNVFKIYITYHVSTIQNHVQHFHFKSNWTYLLNSSLEMNIKFLGIT